MGGRRPLASLLLRGGALALVLGMPGVFGTSLARAQAVSEEDYLFPRFGQPAAALATGLPYVAITDATIGLGRYAALGALVGVTPRVLGLGLRPRFALPLSSALRVYAIAPLLLYPPTILNPPWVLARPTLALEGRATEALRVALGGGALWASSLLSRQGDEVPLSYEAPSASEIAARRARGEEVNSQVLFWTLTASAALQITANDTVFLEVTTVMEDTHLAGHRWTDFGGPPITFALGITHLL
jgi:hypothetical protein